MKYKLTIIFLFCTFCAISVNSGNPGLPENNSENYCNYSFEIITENTTFEKTIKFNFLTNATNYTIEYWIEDSNETVVKSKYNTTKLSSNKQFTPKVYSDYFLIKANLYKDSCISNDSLKVYQIQQNVTNPNNTDSSSYVKDFSIYTKENITQKTIEYRFVTDATNYTIEYWIEDYEGSIVKNKHNTTNTNYKQYTPSGFTNIYFIKARLYTSNYTAEASKMIIFYSGNTCTTNTKDYSKSDDDNDDKSTRSYVKILNKNDLQQFNIKTLKYEIYRGNTLKRTIYFYHNNKKIHSFEIEKYSTIKGKIELELTENINNLVVTELGKEDSVNLDFQETYQETPQVKNKVKSQMLISNLSLDKSSVKFNANSTLTDSKMLCYVYYIKTQVTQIINITEDKPYVKTIILDINDTKLQNKEFKTNYTLKLTCKYKRINASSYKYESLMFNYTISPKIETTNIDSTYSTYLEKTETLMQQSPQKYQNSIIPINSQEDNVYESNRVKIKENSFFSIFAGVSIILTLFILRW